MRQQNSRMSAFLIVCGSTTPVVENHIHRQVGMRCQEFRQPRNDVQSREGNGSTNTQTTRQADTGAARDQFGLVRLVDHAPRMVIKTLSGLGRR